MKCNSQPCSQIKKLDTKFWQINTFNESSSYFVCMTSNSVKFPNYINCSKTVVMKLRKMLTSHGMNSYLIEGTFIRHHFIESFQRIMNTINSFLIYSRHVPTFCAGFPFIKRKFCSIIQGSYLFQKLCNPTCCVRTNNDSSSSAPGVFLAN
jgi:ABC-type uncharacterized transport system fused permease/ATPase subunit